MMSSESRWPISWLWADRHQRKNPPAAIEYLDLCMEQQKMDRPTSLDVVLPGIVWDGGVSIFGIEKCD